MRCRFRGDGGRDRGSVTAELAIALPAVVLVLAFCLSGVRVAGQQLRLQDAAAAAARSLARGDDAQAAAARLVPGSSVSASERGDIVCARVSARASLAGPIGVDLRASSCALGGGR